MPKGNRKKRTQEEYEKEIEEAVKRFRKYPERIRASKDSEEWLNFLDNIGVHENAVSAGGEFWENVRIGVIEDTIVQHPGFAPILEERQIIEARVEVEIYLSSRGNEIIRYRDIETKQWVSRENVEHGRM